MSHIKSLKARLSNYNHDDVHNNGLICTFLNPYSYLFFRKNKSTFSQFDKIYIDGIVLKIMLNIVFRGLKRFSFDMTSVAKIVFEKAEQNKDSMYFVGTTEDAINKFVDNVKENYDLNIVGFRNGYFNSEEEHKEEANRIAKINPDVLVVGMGTPKQEEFLLLVKNKGWSGTGYTCGGFLHQTADKIKYYPNWINKLNMRWLYRIVDEPKLAKRYFLIYPKSVFLITIDLANYFLTRKNHNK